MEAFLSRYWPAIVVVAAGAVVMAVLGFVLEEESAVLWAGGVTGVAVGIAVAAVSGGEKRPDARRRGRRRK